MSNPDISGLILQEQLALKAARSDQCARSHALRLVALRWQRGDYLSVIQVPPELVDGVKQALVEQVIKEWKEGR